MQMLCQIYLDLTFQNEVKNLYNASLSYNFHQVVFNVRINQSNLFKYTPTQNAKTGASNHPNKSVNIGISIVNGKHGKTIKGP